MPPRLYAFVLVLFAGLAGALLWLTPRPRSRHYPMERIDRSLSLIAGMGATNCGRVGMWQDPNKASDCAMHAFSNREPFFVRFVLLGIDSTAAFGLAADSDMKVFAVSYDSPSFKWSTLSLPGQGALSDVGNITIESCPEPIVLRKSEGMLTCYSPDSESP